MGNISFVVENNGVFPAQRASTAKRKLDLHAFKINLLAGGLFLAEYKIRKWNICCAVTCQRTEYYAGTHIDIQRYIQINVCHF